MTKLLGEIKIPGDKSISHRSIMLASIAKGTSHIKGFLNGADCLSTIKCFNKLGINIENHNNELKVYGKGLHGLKKSEQILDCGNSGTTTRLISGILSGQNFDSIVSGDKSIQKRPMDRIIKPLKMMNANINGINNTAFAPLYIKASRLNSIDYISPLSSAQVKSCILLASLYANGITKITEPVLSRNHTELMLKSFGCNIITNDTTSILNPSNDLYATSIDIPGDISSAAFFIAGACICKDSDLIIKNVGINPSRDGILQIAKQMGANIEILKIYDNIEPSADIRIKYSKLNATNIEGKIIPRLIDELPIIAIMACFANGKTIIKDASELKVKESNRINAMVNELGKLGIDIVETDDGMIINGSNDIKIKKACINSYKDHRIAMSFAILNLLCDEEIEINDDSCINISYPDFYKDLKKICF